MPGIVNTGDTLSVTWAKADDYPGIYGTDYVLEVSTTLLPKVGCRRIPQTSPAT